MLKHLNTQFRADVGKAIAEIESQSHAEVVLMVRAHANTYPHYPLAAGIILAFAALSYFRFAPIFFDEWIIYAGTVVAFVLGAVVTGGIPRILRMLVGQRRLHKTTEIIARAYFQKAGIHHTRDKTGVLIFVAVLEQQVVIIADRGVEQALPPKEWQQIQQDFNKIFQAVSPVRSLLEQLDKVRDLFSRYIPQVEDDTNELPDNLDIEL
jgi:putative membrane protein